MQLQLALSRENLVKGYRLMIAQTVPGVLMGIGLHIATYYFAPVDLTSTNAYFGELATYIYVSVAALALHIFGKKILARPHGLAVFRTVFNLHTAAYASALGISCSFIMIALKMHPYSISVAATAMAGAAVAASTFSFDLLACSIAINGIFIPVIYTSIYTVENGTGIASACTLCYIFFHLLGFSVNRTKRRELVHLETIAQQSAALETTNRQLNGSNQMLRGTLESIDELFLIFDKNMVCYATPTDRTAERLSHNPLRRSLTEIFRYSGEKAYAVINWFGLLVSGKIDFEVLAQVGPNEWFDESTLRTYRLRYALLTEKETTTGVIVIMTDITRSLAAEKTALAAEAHARFILSVSTNRIEFHDFVKRTEARLKEFQTTALSLLELRRDLHNIKGTAGMFSLPFLVSGINQFEILLKEFDSDREAESLVKAQAREIEIAFRRWQEDEFELLQKLRVFVPREITIPESFASHVRSSFSQSENDLASFDRIFLRLQSKSLESKLISFRPQVLKVADHLLKKVSFEFLASNRAPYLLTSRFDSIFKTMIHLFNNAVDHGLETANVRISKGKSETGNIVVSAEVLEQRSHHSLLITVEDDGSGLDLKRIAEAAEERGVSTQGLSDFEICQLIFGSLSTKKIATLLSGQGIGLNALAKEVQDCGGTITVYPLPVGSRFEISIPIKTDEFWISSIQATSTAKSR